MYIIYTLYYILCTIYNIYYRVHDIYVYIIYYIDANVSFGHMRHMIMAIKTVLVGSHVHAMINDMITIYFCTHIADSTA